MIFLPMIKGVLDFMTARWWILPVIIVVGVLVWQRHEIDAKQNTINTMTANYVQAAINAHAALADADARAASINKLNTDLQQKIEDQNHEDQAKINAIHTQLVTTVKRLRDPYAVNACGSKLSVNAATTGAVVGNASSSELSTELTGFLEQQAFAADTVAEYARTCHDWVMGLQAPR